MADTDFSSFKTNMQAAINEAASAGGQAAATTIANEIASGTYTITVNATVLGLPEHEAHGAIVNGHAKGGIVNSYAKGSENFHVDPGVALTGEEGPELVWNKNGGYAYVTGQDGPEFADLRPGDRIFNASETKRIFKNSDLHSMAHGGVIDSFASGGWKDGGKDKKGGGGSGSGEEDDWKNDLDWLYNLMENIAELERQQTFLEEEYEDLLKD